MIPCLKTGVNNWGISKEGLFPGTLLLEDLGSRFLFRDVCPQNMVQLIRNGKKNTS